MRWWIVVMLAACSSSGPRHVTDGGVEQADGAIVLADGSIGRSPDAARGGGSDGNVGAADAASGNLADATGGAGGADATSTAGPVHIHIYIANDCTTSTDPVSLSEPSGSSVVLEFHNHSVDYQADVWNTTFNYGFLMLDLGATWVDDKAPVCQIHSTYTETFQINPSGVDSSVCAPAFFTVHCG
jgi:hypothetical protein